MSEDFFTAREAIARFDENGLIGTLREMAVDAHAGRVLALLQTLITHNADKIRWGFGDEKAKAQIPGLERSISIIGQILKSEKKDAS